MHWSQTESSKWSLDCLSRRLGQPRTSRDFFARVSFLRRKTNITQAPGQDSRWAPHSGREDTTRRTGTEAGVGGNVWCPGEGRGRGRCVTSEEVRLDRPASELADCGRPHASRGAALLERGGPLRGGGGRGADCPWHFFCESSFFCELYYPLCESSLLCEKEIMLPR